MSNAYYESISTGGSSSVANDDLPEVPSKSKEYRNQAQPHAQLPPVQARSQAQTQPFSAEEEGSVKFQHTNESIKEAVNLWLEYRPAALKQYGHISDWDTSRVTSMEKLFYKQEEFNEDIFWWNVSAVTNMHAMFYNASSFNQSIGDWNVSAVTNMSIMFDKASSFNQPIGGWNVSAVTNMRDMFNHASLFNQPIGGWNVSAVTSMQAMFYNASSFNQPIGGWNVSAVKNMSLMFDHASSFNQPIGEWNVSAVTHMKGIFQGCWIRNENKPISLRHDCCVIQ